MRCFCDCIQILSSRNGICVGFHPFLHRFEQKIGEIGRDNPVEDAFLHKLNRNWKFKRNLITGYLGYAKIPYTTNVQM